MKLKGKIYRVDRYWIRVQNFGSGGFIAATNNFEVYDLIHQELNYRRTREEAQEDLDNFAIRHSLKEVTEEEKRR